MNDLSGTCPICGKQYTEVRAYSMQNGIRFIHQESLRTKPMPHVIIEKYCLFPEWEIKDYKLNPDIEIEREIIK